MNYEKEKEALLFSPCLLISLNIYDLLYVISACPLPTAYLCAFSGAFSKLWNSHPIRLFSFTLLSILLITDY